MKVLAVDLGGTKTLLQVVELGGEWPMVTCERRYASAEFESFEALLDHFVERSDTTGLQAACIAVAGPVTAREGRQVANVTNLPWTLDSGALGERLGVARCRLANDFVAAAYGVDEVDAGHLVVLQAGEPEPGGSRAVVRMCDDGIVYCRAMAEETAILYPSLINFYLRDCVAQHRIPDLSRR